MKSLFYIQINYKLCKVLQAMQSFALLTRCFFHVLMAALLNFKKERVLMAFGKELQILTPLYFIEF